MNVCLNRSCFISAPSTSAPSTSIHPLSNSYRLMFDFLGFLTQFSCFAPIALDFCSKQNRRNLASYCYQIRNGLYITSQTAIAWCLILTFCFNNVLCWISVVDRNRNNYLWNLCSMHIYWFVIFDILLNVINLCQM